MARCAHTRLLLACAFTFHPTLPSPPFNLLGAQFPGISDSLVAQTVKNLSAMQETRVRSLEWEDPLEKGMATHSSILAWRIPWGLKESDATDFHIKG